MISPRNPFRSFLDRIAHRFSRSAAHGVAAVCALFLAACGNNPNHAPLHTKNPDHPDSPWVVMYIYSPDEARSLDPQVGYDEISHYIVEPVYDTLTQYHPMKTDPYEVEACLLEELPEKKMNPDGTVQYLCHLKKEVMFHDDPCFPGGKGRELVAGDLEYAFQRMCDPQVVCPVVGNLGEYVAGMKDAFEAAKKAGHYDYDHQLVSGIEVIDPHTFKLHLLKPYPQIFYWMALPFTAPVAREAVEYYDGKAHPLFKFHTVGNGPFQLVEHVDGEFYRYVRNKNYRTTVFPKDGWAPERDAVNRPLAGHALPLVDEIQVTVFREILPIWLRTRQGYIDQMKVMKDAANTAITTTQELAPKYRERGMKLARMIEPSTFFLDFNMKDELLGKNKKLRQALSCAYDPQGYVDLAYGGVAPVARQLIPPGLYGFDKDFRNPYGPDLAKAKRLLAEAGYPNGIDPATGSPLELSMDVTATGGEERQLGEYEQRQLEQLGIHVRLIEDTFARLTQKEEDGNYQISSSGWGADYPDPENFFFLFYSKNIPPEGPNYARYSDPEFDQMFDKMATMDNSPERLALIKTMTDKLQEDCPAIMCFNKGYNVIEQPWCPITQLNYFWNRGFKYFTVDDAMRAEKQREWNPVAKWPIPVAVVAVVALGWYGVQLNRRRNV